MPIKPRLRLHTDGQFDILRHVERSYQHWFARDRWEHSGFFAFKRTFVAILVGRNEEDGSLVYVYKALD